MKIRLLAVLSLSASLSCAAEMQVDGLWWQKQVIHSISTQAQVWQITGEQQHITLAKVPSWLAAPRAGEWLELKTRFNPAGIIRRFAWSKSGFDAAYLLAGHSSRLNDAAFGEWYWEAAAKPRWLTLVKADQRVILKPNQIKRIDGWCVQVSDIRPAKASVAGIANESETRFDWWAQQREGLCPPAKP